MALSLERKATAIAGFVAFTMAIVKFVAGLVSGSMAVISSAIDSLLDMTMSLFNLYAVKTSEMNADDTFNYGRGKIEGIAALVEGALIAFSGAFIIYQSARNILERKTLESLESALAVMLCSATVTLLLVLFLRYVGRKTNSLIIRADLLHYKSDLYTNIGIILSLGLIAINGWHIIDSLVSIAIAAFIIVSAYKIAKEGIMVLLDRAIEEPLLSQIIAVINNVPNVRSYHYLRTRRSAKTYVVDVHLVFNDSILLKDAHAASDFVESAIAALIPEAKWLITVHLDPYDDSINV
ncbi:MAG: cation diffusion facilitator family transporter [Helicobacteraceae bacterium]|jgi:cation diffusion facilitator family transporter|nr:cation diffusion facilitator family transporter [Helicobacteraceae bacterium]